MAKRRQKGLPTKNLVPNKDLTIKKQVAQSDKTEGSNMGDFTNILLGKGVEVAEDQPITRKEMGDALTALDAKLEPLLALAGKHAGAKAKREEERKALQVLNALRVAQGKEQYPEDDKEDEDMPKKDAPGEHEKKDAHLAKLEGKLNSL